VSVANEDVTFGASGTRQYSLVIPGEYPDGVYAIEAVGLLNGTPVEGLSDQVDVTLDTTTPTGDDETKWWKTEQLGTDGDDVPLNQASIDAGMSGVMAEAIEVVDWPSIEGVDEADLYNAELGYNCPGESTDWADYTVIESVGHAHPVLPAGSRAWRLMMRLTPRRRTAYWDIEAEAVVRLGVLPSGDVLALCSTPHSVQRLAAATDVVTTWADLSNLADAPTDMAVGDGKVFVASGAIVRVLDQDAGDESYDLAFGADVLSVDRVLWTGTSLLVAASVAGGARIIEWSYARQRTLCTHDTAITALALLGDTLYGGDAAGQVLTISSAGVVTVAYATGEASVTRLEIAGSVHLAGTGTAGKLFSDPASTWGQAADFTMSAVAGLAVSDGWLYAAGAGSGILWRDGATGWEQSLSLSGVTGVGDTIQIDRGDHEALMIGGVGAAGVRLGRVSLAPAGRYQVPRDWVDGVTQRRIGFRILRDE
jgi:hypothetical protein